MLNSKVKELLSDYSYLDGKLPAFSSYGCYPIYYINNHNDVLCATCASEHEDFDETIVDYALNEEDCRMYCEHCNEWIDPALITDKELEIARYGTDDE